MLRYLIGHLSHISKTNSHIHTQINRWPQSQNDYEINSKTN